MIKRFLPLLIVSLSLGLLIWILFPVLSFWSINVLFGPLINLEESSASFVLETKKIEIPRYPHAFNASIVKWKDAFLMSFRIIPEDSKKKSFIGLIWLNENFDPVGEPYIINLNSTSLVSYNAEDARLINQGERLFILYQNNTIVNVRNKDNKIINKGMRVYVAELEYDGKRFFTKNATKLLFPFTQELREKNWVPFIYDQKLFLAYTINPHHILCPKLETGECETVFRSSFPAHWHWGELRGGTPALIVNDQYLAFFHSCMDMRSYHSRGKEKLHYFIGAYTFSTQPPFEITHISSEPITGKHFYEGKDYKPYWKPVQVVFPCGFIFDDQYIWLTYGRQDHEIWVAKLDKKGLLQSLISVNTRE
jgi:predicted GH43/DUF377 family glycosyl hydrolase